MCSPSGLSILHSNKDISVSEHWSWSKKIGLRLSGAKLVACAPERIVLF